jgi:signal recognition particle subunit SRP14
MRVDPDKFLTELNKLFDRTKDKGTVFLTMKRSKFYKRSFELRENQSRRANQPFLPLFFQFIILTASFYFYAAAQKPKRSKVQPTPEDYKCLVRVSDGKRKVSTIVAGKDLSRFQDSYSTLLKVRFIFKKKERPVLCLRHCQLLIHYHRRFDLTSILFCPSSVGPYGCP